MDEKALSAIVTELGCFPVICFKSGLPAGKNEKVGTYETSLFSVTLDDLRVAIDRSANQFLVLHVNGELSTRKFRYGAFGGRLALVESMLLENAIVNGFQPLDMRAASWRNAVEGIAA